MLAEQERSVSAPTQEKTREQWEQEMIADILNDEGQAARSHLQRGFPIYYSDSEYPDDIIRKYPDGRRQIVGIKPDGEIYVIRDL